MTTQTNQTYMTVIGTIGKGVEERTTKTDNKPVANSVVFDNKRAEGDRAYTVTAFGSAVDTLKSMNPGDLVQLRGRYVEKPWTAGAKSGVERVLIIANKGSKILARKKAA